MAMFNGGANYAILGGTFTAIEQVQKNEYEGSKYAMDCLLDASSPAAFHNSIDRAGQPRCHPNTRLAVLHQVSEWSIGKAGWDKFIMWLYGPAMAGKSAILQSFAERCAFSNDLLASYFFSRKDPKRNTEKEFVATLVYQIALKIPGYWTHIQSTIEKNPLIFQCTFGTQFQELIVQPFLHLSRTGLFLSATLPYLIIIDGLDECQGSDTQQVIVETISNTFHHHHDTLPFMFLISSRPEHNLAASFSSSRTNGMTFRLAIDDTFQPESDIRTYFIDSFNLIRNTHPLRIRIPTSWPARDDIDTLVKKSSGQFCYAATVLKYVGSARHKPVSRLKVILGELPVNNDKPYRALDALYMDILSQAHDIEGALRLLVLRPLVCYHLGWMTFMFLDKDDVQLLLQDLAAVVNFDYDNAVIRFLHAPFLDFLMDPTRSMRYHKDPRHMHREIVLLCIRHINRSVEFGVDWSPQRSSLSYSLNHVMYHLGKASDVNRVCGEMLRMKYIQCLPDYRKEATTTTWTERTPVDLLQHFFLYLKTSKFSNTTDLFLHHRGYWDQMLLDKLSKIPEDLGRSICIVLLDFSMPQRWQSCHKDDWYPLRVISALFPSVTRTEIFQCAAYIYSFVDIKGEGALEYTMTPTEDYHRLLLDLFTDARRVGHYLLDESKYTVVSESLVEFCTTHWDGNWKGRRKLSTEWYQIWDILSRILPKAGYSEKLIGMMNHTNLTSFPGRSARRVNERLQAMVQAIGAYLKKFSGAIPEGLNIAIDCDCCNEEYHDTSDSERALHIVYYSPSSFR